MDFYADPAWPFELDAEVSETLNRLMEAVDADPTDYMSYPEAPSGEPFCGCEVCVQREILTIAVNRTVEAVAAGRIQIPGVVLVAPAAKLDPPPL